MGKGHHPRIGKLLRAELVRRGMSVVLTRATDTLIDLANRPLFCRADCDLFVSIHVNAMPPGRRQLSVVEMTATNVFRPPPTPRPESAARGPDGNDVRSTTAPRTTFRTPFIHDAPAAGREASH